MITAAPQDIIEEARRLLKKSTQPAAKSLTVLDEYVQQGEWLHLAVAPTVAGISALDFVDAIEAIEADLRRKFGDEVLIVPAGR